MRVGVGLPNTVPNTRGDVMMAWAQQAEAGPFSSVAVFDRIQYDSYEPLTTLAAIAAVTKRVRLASLVIVAPIRNTALLAKMAASLDALSGGRFTMGVAVGARAEDYVAAGVPTAGRGARLTQQLIELRRFWEADSVGPRLNQANKPEVLVGGLSDSAFARMARYADGYVHGGGPPRAFEAAAIRARAAWNDLGRPGLPQIWGMGYFAFGEEQARLGAGYLRDYYAFTGPFAERIAQGLLSTPQAIAQFMRGYAEAGCDELVLFPTSSDPVQLEQLVDVIA